MRLLQNPPLCRLCSSNSILKKRFYLLDFAKRLEISEAEIVHKHPSPGQVNSHILIDTVMLEHSTAHISISNGAPSVPDQKPVL